MKIRKDSIELTLHDITGDSIADVIIAACQEDDYLASGTIGPSFACSGPGSGWQANYGVSDYAKRALSESMEYGGAIGYINADDGRLATLNDDGEVEWTDESVVELVAPEDDEIDEDRETVAMMLAALKSGQCIEGSGDWDRVRALYAVSDSDALERIDGEIVGDWIIHYDDSTHRWYRADRAYLVELRALMGSADEEIAGDAYSHWCAGYPHDGEYETQEEAIAAAEGGEG